VYNNVIETIGKEIAIPEVDGTVAKVDCAVKTLMPGLIDMHSHLCCLQEGMMDGRDEYEMMAGHGSHDRSGFDGLSPARLDFITCRDDRANVLGIAEAMNLGHSWTTVWSCYYRDWPMPTMTPVGTIDRCIEAGVVMCIEHGFFMSEETIMARMAKEGVALSCHTKNWALLKNRHLLTRLSWTPIRLTTLSVGSAFGRWCVGSGEEVR
jgi:imidazolonepropionase-like amidohydrolase